MITLFLFYILPQVLNGFFYTIVFNAFTVLTVILSGMFPGFIYISLSSLYILCAVCGNLYIQKKLFDAFVLFPVLFSFRCFCGQ